VAKFQPAEVFNPVGEGEGLSEEARDFRDDGEDAEGLRIVNLSELAMILDISSTALTDQIRRDQTFPVLERGSNGVAYRFDLDAVKAYRDAKQAAIDEATARRNADLAKWRLDFYGETADPEESFTLSPAERRAEADAIRLEDYNRRQRGELVERSALISALASAVMALRQGLLPLATDFAKRHGLTREQRIELEGQIGARIDQLSDTLSDAGFYND
jgi:phage terminase Nu1 subunit (DNA packaging protein)